MSIYDELGVKPIINATGSVTRLGGAPMPPEVLRAYAEAAAEAVPLERLQGAASRVIAELTGAEAGLVTAGAAAALTLGAAAILTGYDAGRMERLPHCDGFAHEFVVAREQRNGYDHAVRAAGARLVEVGFHEIVANAGVRRTEAWEYDDPRWPPIVGSPKRGRAQRYRPGRHLSQRSASAIRGHHPRLPSACRRSPRAATL